MLTHGLSFQARKSLLEFPKDRVIGSTTELPDKILGLRYLETRAQQLSAATSLTCHVPNFVCIRTGEALAQALSVLDVCEANLTQLQNPLEGKTRAQIVLNETLRRGYALACSRLDRSSGLVIRSAGQGEDGETHSYAGVYTSLEISEPVDQSDFIETSKQVALSPFAPAALRYHYFNNAPVQPIDIIVQQLVKNPVPLNFTVLPECVESIEVVGLAGYTKVVFLPAKDGKPGIFIDPTSGSQIDTLIMEREFIEQLHLVVAGAFCEEAKRNGKISIECAFTYEDIDQSRNPKELALLQIRPLPKPVEKNSASESNATSPLRTQRLLSIHTHLIAGPHSFDSMIVLPKSAAISRHLGLELLTVVNRLREKQCTRPLVVLEHGLTSQHTSAREYILRAVANQQIVGVIDQGIHTNRGGNNVEAFAGHTGALLSERLGLFVNAPDFMDQLKGVVELEELREQIVPTQLELLLASDLTHDNLPSGGVRRVAGVYRPKAPFTLEVIKDPNVSMLRSGTALADDLSKLKLVF